MNLIMDCSRNSNVDRDLDICDDSHSHHSHDDHSDDNDDMRDCDSVDGEINLNNSIRSSVSTAMDFGIGDGRSPEPNTDMSMSHGHHSQFPSNHPLGALGNFMGMAGLHGLPNLQHGDVLEKLKMQVRDMKVGLMDQDYSTHNGFGGNSLTTPVNTAFTLPPTTLNNFSHSPQNLSQSHSQPQQIQSPMSQQQQQQSQQNSSQNMHTNGFSFTSPTPPSTKDANPASNSSTSSETSNSSQQNNGWSFEEQYKQVRQLYEINDDPKRKEFLDDLFSFMQKRGTPINRLPIMAKSVLDLYELYNLVIARGGLVDVINKKLWQEIIKGLHLPSSITSAAFTLRTQYMKYLYPYECEKKNLSSPSELQAAIDGNRREGRRSSYGQFEAMHSQLQMPQMQRGNVPSGMPQMSPLALVTHSNAAQAAAAHHRLMAPTFGQVPNLVTHELEQRMMEYLKLIQAQKEQPRQRSQSPETTTREALNALEMSRVALWSMYHNNTSPPSSVNTSPQGIEPQREALNLSDSPPSVTIKRERDIAEPALSDREDFNQPPPKRGIAVNYHLPSAAINSSSDFNDDEDYERNSALNSSHDNIDNDHRMSMDDDKASHHLLRHQKSSPSSSSTSPIKHHLTNGISNNNNNNTNNNNNNNNNNNTDQPFMSGMQFKISRRENGPNGDQQLVVNMELNGVQYEGILFASVSTPSIINGSDKRLTPIPLPQQSPVPPIDESTVAALKKDVALSVLDERTPRLVSS